jgi:hypothetical protein
MMLSFIWNLYFQVENKTDKEAAFQCLSPIILFAIIYWLPESPRWLLMNDRYEEARKVILRSHSEEEAKVELVQIQAQMQIDRTLDRSYLHIFRKPSYRKRALLAIGTCCMANGSGVLVINSKPPILYCSIIFAKG